MAGAAVEREVKLDAPGGFVLPDLSRLEGVATAEADAVELDAVYVDTEALDLVRRGASLRRREEPGGTVWTLKLPGRLARRRAPVAGEARLPVLHRHEIDDPSPSTAVPDRLRAVAAPWFLDRAIRPVTRLHTRRRRLRLVDPVGGLLAEVTDDEVTVWDPAAPAAPVTVFRELEVEAGPTAEIDDLAHVVAALERAGAGATHARSKVARALGPAAEIPPDLPGPPPGRGAGTPELLGWALRGRVAELLDADVCVRVALWADEHRDLLGPVAAMLRAERAVRALLRVARPLLDRDASDDARAVLRRLAAPLLRAHDATVAASALGSGVAALDEDDRIALEPLVHEVVVEAEAAGQLLSARLGSEAHLELLVGLVALATDPPLGTDVLGGPSPSTIEVADGAWRRLEQAVGRVRSTGRAAARDLEDLRPRVRRAWAAAVVAAPIDEEASRRAERLEPLVVRLDELRDALWVEDRLRGLALGAPRPQVLALGQLLGEARRHTDRLASSWPAWWGEAAGTGVEQAAAASS